MGKSFTPALPRFEGTSGRRLNEGRWSVVSNPVPAFLEMTYTPLVLGSQMYL
jgi:hypothetical protein